MNMGDIMVAILTDTKYANSLWCKNLYTSLIAVLRQKRIPFCEITDTVPCACDAVFIIASDFKWTTDAIRQLNASGISPILLCNQSEHLPGCIYSCVCSDINTSMKNLLDTLKTDNKKRIALYGVNTNSIADISRVNSLFVWREEDVHTLQVFVNDGSLYKCFEEFYTRMEEFDAVICANDFTAVSLVRHLQECAPAVLERLPILSCAETKIAEYYRPYIRSLKINFEQYGRAAVYVYEALKKHTYLSDMTVSVVWTLEDDSTQSERCETALHFTESEDNFYSDPELSEMLILDKLLSNSDDTDILILKALLSGKSYEEIADICYLAEGSIKYRIKNMVANSGAADKQHLLSLLPKYNIVL